MAIDHALAVCLGGDEAVLRLYEWSRPTVSLGRNEPARGVYRTASGSVAGPPARVDFVRRPTGGRAVAHWRELTYAVVAPTRAWGGLRAAYLAINGALAEALTGLGVPVGLAGARECAGGEDRRRRPLHEAPSEADRPPLRPDAGPCFRAPAPGEVVAAGRKLVGSAQARLEGALLQHGSILREDDQGLLEGMAAGPGGATPTAPGPTANGRSLGRPATLRELIGHVSIDALTGQVAMSLRETFGGTWGDEGYRPLEIETAERLEADRYARASWTWRR
jgi:lipoate-protein ligase A